MAYKPRVEIWIWDIFSTDENIGKMAFVSAGFNGLSTVERKFYGGFTSLRETSQENQTRLQRSI